MLKLASYIANCFCAFSFHPEFEVKGVITKIVKKKFEGA
jgi:hypothetical protein